MTGRCTWEGCNSPASVEVDGKGYCLFHAKIKLAEAAAKIDAKKPAVSKKTLSKKVKSALKGKDA